MRDPHKGKRKTNSGGLESLPQTFTTYGVEKSDADEKLGELVAKHLKKTNVDDDESI